MESEVLTEVFSTRLFTQSFMASIKDKLLKTGYVETDILYRHYSVTERSSLLYELSYPQLESLLHKSQTNEATFINVLKGINELPINEDLLLRITPKIGFVIISWLLYCNKQRYTGVIRNELAKWISTHMSNVIYTDQKYLIKKDIDYRIVDSLTSFIHIILELAPLHHVFFRGQDSLNYWIQPSINRTGKLFQNEARLYQELILRCPNDFSKCKSHLDYLVEMQHYSNRAYVIKRDSIYFTGALHLPALSLGFFEKVLYFSYLFFLLYSSLHHYLLIMYHHLDMKIHSVYQLT